MRAQYSSETLTVVLEWFMDSQSNANHIMQSG